MPYSISSSTLNAGPESLDNPRKKRRPNRWAFPESDDLYTALEWKNQTGQAVSTGERYMIEPSVSPGYEACVDDELGDGELRPRSVEQLPSPAEDIGPSPDSAIVRASLVQDFALDLERTL